MSEYDFCLGVYRRLYLDMQHWMSRWITDGAASELAASVFRHLFNDACRGLATTYGPYKTLYSYAEFRMRSWESAHKNIVPFKVWTTVPVPTQEFLSELARAYAMTRMVCELGQVTKEERHLVCTMIEGGRFDSDDHWAPALSFNRMPQVRHILGRTILNVTAHVCTEQDACPQYGSLWRTEELKGARWRADFLYHARENVHGY